MKRIRVFIEQDGDTVTCVHNDLIAPIVAAVGKSRTVRASDVEPDDENNWTADMSRVEPGVVLGPFATREQALTEEVKWLDGRMVAGKVVVR